MSTRHCKLHRGLGFTLVELLVVLVIISTLITIAVPRYFASVERSKEAVLRQNLRAIRDAIDKFHADNERYPESLEVLATSRYLRSVPIDPMTESATTWIAVPPREEPSSPLVYDVKSGASGNAKDGTAYGEW